MCTQRSVSVRHRIIQAAVVVILLGSILLVSACGGDPRVQQQATQDQTRLDSLLKQAQTIGVPAAQLQPIIQQERQLHDTSTPLTFFNDQPITDYYKNLDKRYSQLALQVQGVIVTNTQHTQKQAQQDLKVFQATLSQRQLQGLPVQNFTKQYNEAQSLLGTAQYPKDYINISTRAHTAVQSLDLMRTVASQLATFKDTFTKMQGSNLDVTVMQTQYQNDQQLLSGGTQPADFQKLNAQISAQYEQAVVNSTQAIPYIAAVRLTEISQQIQLLQKYGIDPAPYQKKLDADQATLKQGLKLQDYQKFSQQVDSDKTSMDSDLIRGEANYLTKQFHQEVDSWGQSHMYHDDFNGQNYVLDAGYQQVGIGSDLDGLLSQANTPNDYQAVVDLANNDLFNLHMMEQDFNDKAPYSQVHSTDTQLLNYYKATKGQVIVVSLVEQSMRIYQDGNLVKSFLVTTGRPELPSVPGIWQVLNRQSPTIFKSSEPRSSPYWYPDTPIHFAILYHEGGYFIHDAWWRADYGPGTQFPHSDSSGDAAFSNNGSHGCINMQEDQAAWVYNNTNWQTQIIVY